MLVGSEAGIEKDHPGCAPIMAQNLIAAAENEPRNVTTGIDVDAIARAFTSGTFHPRCPGRNTRIGDSV
jgi:hypothetical protein